MKYLFGLLLFLVLSWCVVCYTEPEILTKSFEYAYSEGQKDALKGDYKIKYDSTNKTWYWIKSPWIDKTIPTYDLNGDPLFKKK
jgi:hypothetical protein